MSAPAPDLQQAPLPGRGIQLLDSLRNHARLAIISFIVIFLAGLPLVFLKGVPKYQATATIQVAPRYMKNLKEDNELDFQSNQQYRQFVEQQTRTINRYDILKDALQNLPPEVSWRREGESERRAIERLQTDLRIMPVPDTYLIQISLEDSKPNGLAEILNGVIAAYLAKAREERVYGADERVKQLQARESELLAGIDSLTRQRSDIARELGVTAFKEGDGNPFDKLVQKLREDIAEARSRRFDAEAKQAAFGKSGETDLQTRSIQESVLIDPGLNSLKSGLNKRRADLLMAISGLAPEHPGYLAAQQEIGEIESELRRHTEQLTRQLHEGMSKRYATAVDQSRRLETDLQAALAETATRSEAYAARFNRAATLSADIEQLRKELDSVRERLNFFAVEANSQGQIRPVSPALPPEQAFGTGKKKLLIIVLFAAFAGGLVAPIIRDLLDRRVRTINDAQRCLGFAPLGWLIEHDDSQHQGFAEDLLRRMASALIREQDRQGTTTIALTGVKPGAGTSRLVCDLARTLNRLGVATLALEANAFRPDSCYGEGPGLTALLEDPSSTPAINLVDGLPLLNVGQHIDQTIGQDAGDSVGQRQLDGLDRLGGVLATLGQNYRFILIDTPPLLTASDSELIIRAAGSVILVVEAESVSQGEVKRAARLLEKLDPPSVGAIVNRINPFHGGGYIESLIAEHESGRRQTEGTRQAALRDTLQVLFLNAWALLRQLGNSLKALPKKIRAKRGERP